MNRVVLSSGTRQLLNKPVQTLARPVLVTQTRTYISLLPNWEDNTPVAPHQWGTKFVVSSVTVKKIKYYHFIISVSWPDFRKLDGFGVYLFVSLSNLTWCTLNNNWTLNWLTRMILIWIIQWSVTIRRSSILNLKKSKISSMPTRICTIKFTGNKK